MHKLLMGFFLSAVMLISSGCDKEHCFDCFKGTGEMQQEARNPGEFSEILLSGNINLILTRDSSGGCVVEAGKNLLDGIITETVDGVLNIRDENKCHWVRSYKYPVNVYLNVKSLRNIEYLGAGDVSCTNTLINDTIEMNLWDGSGLVSLQVDCKEVRVHLHTGCGDVTVSGHSESTNIYSRGNGRIRCSDLMSNRAYVDSKCTGDIDVQATHELFARIGYIGDVYYWGHPVDIETQISERGRLIPGE